MDRASPSAAIDALRFRKRARTHWQLRYGADAPIGEPERCAISSLDDSRGRGG